MAARSVTYRELDEASNRLAHALIGRGAGPGRCVALVVERGAEAVVAVLGVLKTGAAYVPIDAALPRERIGFMLADAAPVLAVCTAGLGSRVGEAVPVIDVEDPAVAAQPPTAPTSVAAGELAYVIYTSGTTGVPKGVGVTHAQCDAVDRVVG